MFHTLHKAFFNRESYTENQQRDDSAQRITHSGEGKWATPWTLFIYLLFGLCSMTVILPRNGKTVSGNESSTRKEMGQDCIATWEDCKGDWKCCWTGKSQKLICSLYAAGSHGEHSAKAFNWEMTVVTVLSIAAGPCKTLHPQHNLQRWLKTWKKCWCTWHLWYTVPGVMWD